MVGMKMAASPFHIHKTLNRTAVQAYEFTFLSSQGTANLFDIHEKLFMIIRT